MKHFLHFLPVAPLLGQISSALLSPLTWTLRNPNLLDRRRLVIEQNHKVDIMTLFNRHSKPEVLRAKFPAAGSWPLSQPSANKGVVPYLPSFREIGRRFGRFDLTMLKIGAWDPLWAEIHIVRKAPCAAVRALGGHGLLMPIHWGLFDLALHHWRQPIEKVWSVEGLKLWSPTPGVPSELITGEELRSEWQGANRGLDLYGLDLSGRGHRLQHLRFLLPDPATPFGWNNRREKLIYVWSTSRGGRACWTDHFAGSGV